MGAEIVKVELNDALSGKVCKSPVSSGLVSLDGTWWVIDVNDPDLEAHLKQSAHRAKAARTQPRDRCTGADPG